MGGLSNRQRQVLLARLKAPAMQEALLDMWTDSSTSVYSGVSCVQWPSAQLRIESRSAGALRIRDELLVGFVSIHGQVTFHGNRLCVLLMGANDTCRELAESLIPENGEPDPLSSLLDNFEGR